MQLPELKHRLGDGHQRVTAARAVQTSWRDACCSLLFLQRVQKGDAKVHVLCQVGVNIHLKVSWRTSPQKEWYVDEKEDVNGQGQCCLLLLNLTARWESSSPARRTVPLAEIEFTKCLGGEGRNDS